MNTYISLLRGINVSGQKIIKMTELTALYESLKFQNVKTYIQSGNVIFQTDDAVQPVLKLIRREIERQFGFDVVVLIRTSQELQRLVDQNTLLQQTNGDPKGHYVCFLEDVPDKQKVEQIGSIGPNAEKMIYAGNELYLFYPNGIGTSKWSTNFFEKTLGVRATTRNWNTVLKLIKLAE